MTSYHSLERELILGLALLAGGVVLGLDVILSWSEAGYGSLQGVRESVMAMILTIMGIQTIFSAIFVSLLLLKSENGYSDEVSRGEALKAEEGETDKPHPARSS